MLAVIAISPGDSRLVPWQGSTYTQILPPGATCACQEESAVQSGTFEAYTQVFADYQCSPAPCKTAPDGTITMASPHGGAVAVSTTFTVPYASDEVVLVITSLPTTDAGAPQDLAAQDVAVPDLSSLSDSIPDGFSAPFADVPGHTFEIAASHTAPDASSKLGWACNPADPNATYRLTFSDDGTKVTIVRSDPVQEPIMEGTLTQSSDSRLVYAIKISPADGELSLRRDNGVLTAQLSRFGSGVPVIACIDSPMRSL